MADSLYFSSDRKEELVKNTALRYWTICLNFDHSNRFSGNLKKLKLKWSKPKPFKRPNKRYSPINKPGIYLFFIKPKFKLHSEHSYIMYIGYTMNLQSRYEDYLQYQNSDSPNLLYKRIMLNIWEDYLYYSYVVINGDEETIKGIEKMMISSVVPPINKEFLDAEVKKEVDLYRKR